MEYNIIFKKKLIVNVQLLLLLFVGVGGRLYIIFLSFCNWKMRCHCYCHPEMEGPAVACASAAAGYGDACDTSNDSTLGWERGWRVVLGVSVSTSKVSNVYVTSVTCCRRKMSQWAFRPCMKTSRHSLFRAALKAWSWWKDNINFFIWDSRSA